MKRRAPYLLPALRELASRYPCAFALVALLLAACEAPDATVHASGATPLVATGAVTVLPRTEHIPTYPCSRCHDEDQPTNRTERKLELHNRIHLDHMETDRWCYTCHSDEDIDKLRLPNGKLVDFDDSSEVCGACHGEKHRDWKLNIHGLTTGFWNGPKQRRACTACHNPHQPPFQTMEPLPAPERPRTVKPDALPLESHPP